MLVNFDLNDHSSKHSRVVGRAITGEPDGNMAILLM